MIKIVKGTDTKVVTKGAYESFYKPLGYTTVDSIVTKSKKSDVKVENKSEKTDEVDSLKTTRATSKRK